METNSLRKIQTKILNDFQNDFTLCFTSEERAYCYLQTKRIYINLNDFLNPTYRSLFDLLHEIGHIKTNTNKMRRFEEEYYATVWAISKYKKYNIKLSSSDKRDFDKYIIKLAETCRKRKGKNIPNNNDLVLNW